MTYNISFSESRCVLCRYCEIVCAFSMGDEFDPDASHIREIRAKVDTVEFTCDPPEACLAEPRCVDSCDQQAIRYTEA